jgi:hypothetical protein
MSDMENLLTQERVDVDYSTACVARRQIETFG